MLDICATSLVIMDIINCNHSLALAILCFMLCYGDDEVERVGDEVE